MNPLLNIALAVFVPMGLVFGKLMFPLVRTDVVGRRMAWNVIFATVFFAAATAVGIAIRFPVYPVFAALFAMFGMLALRIAVPRFR